MTRRRTVLVGIALGILGLLIAIALAYHKALHEPPNIVWVLASGYYHYDPRTQNPPPGLFLDRVEPSLQYFMDATLKRCGGTYPSLSALAVTQYHIEDVEYLGHTDYHAWSLVHTRIYFANGTSKRVVFRFEAGHNEGYFLISNAYPLLLTNASTVNAAAWMAVGGLLRDPDVLPPGWSHYVVDGYPLGCNPGAPFRIE